MYVIRKKFSFSAAHHLVGLPVGHPCLSHHGHNYEIEVVLRSNFLNDVSFLRDYLDLNEFKKWLDETCDHKDLNEVFPDMQTSAENLARIFYNVCAQWWPETYMLRVSETPKTWAEFYVV